MRGEDKLSDERHEIFEISRNAGLNSWLLLGQIGKAVKLEALKVNGILP